MVEALDPGSNPATGRFFFRLFHVEGRTLFFRIINGSVFLMDAFTLVAMTFKEQFSSWLVLE